MSQVAKKTFIKCFFLGALLRCPDQLDARVCDGLAKVGKDTTVTVTDKESVTGIRWKMHDF